MTRPRRPDSATHLSTYVGAGVRGDGGSVTLFMVITVTGLLLMAGLVVDGGNRLRDIQNADALAAQAARAAGQQIDTPAAITGQPPTLDPVRAVAAARAFLAAQGLTGEVTVDPGTRELQVTVHTSSPTVFLGLIGISHLDADGHASIALIPTAPVAGDST